MHETSEISSNCTTALNALSTTGTYGCKVPDTCVKCEDDPGYVQRSKEQVLKMCVGRLRI